MLKSLQKIIRNKWSYEEMKKIWTGVKCWNFQTIAFKAFCIDASVPGT